MVAIRLNSRGCRTYSNYTRLAGHGSDKTPASDITMETYVNQLTAILDSQQEKVVLVGHSFNGIIISRVA